MTTPPQQLQPTEPRIGCDTVDTDLDMLPCSAAADVEVLAGCVHEHVVPRRLCMPHAAKLASGEMICLPCCTSADPHKCDLVRIPRDGIVELGGEAQS